MTAVLDILREVVQNASCEFGRNINYLWGDWAYISNKLILMSKNADSAANKYPVICLFSPFTEEKTDKRFFCKTSVNLLIATNTLSAYDNEQRKMYSFEQILIPVYNAFIKSLLNDKRFYFSGDIVPHSYSENYGYGSKGVMMSNGKPFNDLIDGIDITNLQLTIKKDKCYGKRL